MTSVGSEFLGLQYNRDETGFSSVFYFFVPHESLLNCVSQKEGEALSVDKGLEVCGERIGL